MKSLTALLVLMPTAALAQAAPAAEASAYASMLPLLAIFAVFYFLLIRPQQKRAKEHQAMLGELKKGDEVVTAGGIVGRVTKVADGDQVQVEIAKGVEVAVIKSTITTVLGKVPAKGHDTDKKESKGNKNDNVVPSKDLVANDN